jgi:PAS domain S-box-containing protein
MHSEVFKSLVNNAAFLLALCVFYDIVAPFRSSTQGRRRFLVGILIGITGMLVMLNPWRFNEGIIFDTRSVLLCISGLFFGFVPTAIATAMTSALRLFQGGEAALVGCCVIVSSSLIGLLWAKFRRRFFGQNPHSWIELYIFGIVVHLNMLAWMLLLKSSAAVLEHISMSVMLIYPVLTVILGMLLTRQNERIKSRQATKISEQRFRTLSENLPDVIVRYDQDLRIVNANPAAVKFCQSSQEKLIDSKNEDVNFLYNQGEFFSNKLRELFLSGRTERLELELEMPTGKALLDFLLVPEFLQGENKVNSIIALGRDISRDREMERRLRDSEKLDSVGRLAAGVAHDLNNRLTPALGYAELLHLMLEADSKQAGYAQEVIDSVKSSMKLVDCLLALGAKQNLSCQKLDLVEIVKNYVNEIQRKKLLDLEFNLSLPEDQCFCQIDQNQIQEMLYQLFLNVRDFAAEQNTVSVTVEKQNNDLSQEEVKDNYINWAIIKISDKGPGITEQNMKHLFEPFFTTKEAGEGLGMPVARGIAVAHGGHLRVSSVINQGTEVKIYLPQA